LDEEQRDGGGKEVMMVDDCLGDWTLELPSRVVTVTLCRISTLSDQF
jgi:hypothetical protein